MGSTWKTIRTKEELKNLEKIILSSVLETVATEGVKLLKDIAMEKMSLGGSSWYERSGQFEEAWGLIEKDLESVTLGYLEDMITPNLELYQHGNIYFGEFLGDDLAETILNGYEVFNTGIQIEARDIWGEFISQFNEKLPLWVNKALS